MTVYVYKIKFYFTRSVEKRYWKMNKVLLCVESARVRSFSGLFFSRIRTEYEDLQSKSPFSVRIRENTEQKNSK